MNKIKQVFSIKNGREWILAAVDAALVFFSILAAVLICKIDVINSEIIVKTLIASPFYIILAFFYSLVFGIYRTIWRYAVLKDYVKIAVAQLIAGALFIILDLLALRLIRELTCYIVAVTFVITSQTFIRIIYAFLYARANEKSVQQDVRRTMVIGAGYSAKAILEELVRKQSFYKPICIIDDDVNKIGRELFGIPVVGNTNEIPKFARRYDIATIIFAIPSISENSRKTILGNCIATNCELKILPYMSEMIHNVDIVGQIKDVNIEDLLGRAPIKFDESDVSEYIKGNNVMITGGGGSIGSELVRQIAKLSPNKIIIVEIYENCAYSIQQEIWRQYGRAFPLYVEIASVTDYDKMNDLFTEYSPDVIFHAAAHKHVPLMETNPEEAVKNNVFGTYNVVQLANIYKIKKFIMISTDKAVNPTNVMGATKRCCEMVVQYMAQQKTSTEFASVRFGNVLGSNGSVIPLFTDQIKSGGPVTVTHKDIIRYFMTIPEAVSLVLQAGTFAKGGKIFVLDMGSPVKIVSLAENLIRMLGKKPYEEIDIKFTGLRPGEKLYEELLTDEEGMMKTSNNKIFVGQQTEIDCDKLMAQLNHLNAICKGNNKALVVEQLKKIVTTFNNDKSLKDDKKVVKFINKKSGESLEHIIDKQANN